MSDIKQAVELARAVAADTWDCVTCNAPHTSGVTCVESARTDRRSPSAALHLAHALLLAHATIEKLALVVEAPRIYTNWQRQLSTGEWSCQCGCCPVGPDIDTVRRCLKDMADEIDRLRLVEAKLERAEPVVEAAREGAAAVRAGRVVRAPEELAMLAAIDALSASAKEQG